MMNRWRTSRLKSFHLAFSGIWFNLKHEPNFLIQLIAAFLVVVLGIYFGISRVEWLFVILSIGAVLAAETLNTAIEKICDRFIDEQDFSVKIIKDSAAAAVLLTSIAAALIGCIVFIPYVKALLI